MKWLKWLGMLLLVVVAGIAALFGVAWVVDRSAATTVYVVNDPALAIPTDSHALAQGAHLYATRTTGPASNTSRPAPSAP
jgi:hypothetical protein